MKELNSRWARVQHKRYTQTRKTYYQSRQQWQKQMADGMKCWEDVMDKYKLYFNAVEEMKASGGSDDSVEKIRKEIVDTIEQFLKIAKSNTKSTGGDVPSGSRGMTLDELDGAGCGGDDDDDDSDCCDCDCGCDG